LTKNLRYFTMVTEYQSDGIKEPEHKRAGGDN